MKSGGITSQAIDLSLKSNNNGGGEIFNSTKVFKPEPRPAWSILWYRSIWPKFTGPSQEYTQEPILLTPHQIENQQIEHELLKRPCYNEQEKDETRNEMGVDLTLTSGRNDLESIKEGKIPTVTDVATCDGPVRFLRISNPNFALTVEHRESSSSGIDQIQQSPPTSKTYLCIYCNQSFKSLFCYQKHKKRHLNPVSVDITATPNIQLTHTLSENTIRTADLNVQFFPCKKCGSKFPSYYFVHKHKKVCL